MTNVHSYNGNIVVAPYLCSSHQSGQLIWLASVQSSKSTKLSLVNTRYDLIAQNTVVHRKMSLSNTLYVVVVFDWQRSAR